MKTILYLIVIIVLFIGFIRYLEYTSVFHPERVLASTPQKIGLPFEELTIQAYDDVKIHGWLIKAPSAKSTLLFFHGNAGNIGDRLGKIALFHKMGLNVLIIDYRGYGKSEGRPTEKGVYIDALSTYDYVIKRDDLKDLNIVSYGASLGGAIAVDLASKRAVNGLIIDSSFSSAADMAKRIYPFIPSFLINTKLDSMSKMNNMFTPKLFIHSVDDQTVPFELGMKLYDAASIPKEFIKIVGGHNDGHIHDEVKITSGMRQFLEQLDLI